jgi:hypothetical protein
LQDRDAIVKGLKAQIKNAITMSGGQPQAKIMEPLLNQPTNSFEFAFKIRVRPAGSCTVLLLSWPGRMVFCVAPRIRSVSRWLHSHAGC